MGERREVVDSVLNQHPKSCVSKVCQFASYSRTQFYYNQKETHNKSSGRPIPGFTINRDGKHIYDDQIVNLLKKYRSEIHFMNAGGNKVLVKYLALEHQIYINHKKIYRLCHENNLLLHKVSRLKSKIKKKRCEYQEISAPNQLWQFDLKHIYIHGERSWSYLLTFIDVYSKKVVGFAVARSIKAGQLMITLSQALMSEGIDSSSGLKIRSDNGPQMSSNRFHFYLKRLEQKLKHEFIPPRTPNRNAYIEAFFSIFEASVIQVQYFNNFGDVYKSVVDFIEFYNTRRLHGSIGFISPKTFLEKYEKGEITNYRFSA
jgi:putative transposase